MNILKKLFINKAAHEDIIQEINEEVFNESDVKDEVIDESTVEIDDEKDTVVLRDLKCDNCRLLFSKYDYNVDFSVCKECYNNVIKPILGR